MRDIKDLTSEIDKRNRFCKEVYVKPDTDSFCFDTYIKETIEMADEIGYEDGYYYAKIISAIRRMGLGDYEEGYSILKKMIEVKPLKDLSLWNQMKYYSCIGSYHSDYTGDLELAVENARLELEKAYELDHINEIMRIKMNLGSLNNMLKFYDTAEAFLSETLGFYISTQNDILLAYNYLHIGEMYLGKMSYELAKKYFLKSVEFARKEGLMYIIHYSDIGLAKVEKEDQNYHQAIEYLKEAIDLSKELESNHDEFEIRLELVEIFLILGQYDKAAREIKLVESVIHEIKNEAFIKAFYKNKAEVNFKLGNKDLAYRTLIDFIGISEQQSKSSSQIAMNNMIQKEHEKTLEKLETIAAVGRQLTALSSLDQVLINIRSELQKVIQVDAIGVGALEDDTIFFNHYYIGDKKAEASSILVDDKNSLAAWCIVNDNEIIINDLETKYNEYVDDVCALKVKNSDEHFFAKSVMYAPLKVDGKIIGVFTIQSQKKDAYSSIEVNIFQIIQDYVAISLVNISRKIELERLSVRDNLTDMYNRRGFMDYYNKFINRQDNDSIAIIMLDLDLFKKINDKYGHIVGDRVLSSVAKSFMEKEGEGICCARLGGEEFGIIVFNRDYPYVKALAERIRSDIAMMVIEVDEIQVQVTTSVGVTFKSIGEVKNYDQLYYEADKALYMAKGDGRNKVKYFNH